jgi:membrane fusion protein (multidrug efflux system)
MLHRQILLLHRPAIAAADAQIEAAKVNVWQATQDYNRYANLIKDHAVTQQQFEQAQAAKERAEKQLLVLEQQKLQAAKQTNAVASQSSANFHANRNSQRYHQTTAGRCG